MKNAKWISKGILAVVLCSALGAAHAQSNTLRKHSAVVTNAAGNRMKEPVKVASIVEIVARVFENAIRDMIGAPRACEVQMASNTPAFDERLFDKL